MSLRLVSLALVWCLMAAVAAFAASGAAVAQIHSVDARPTGAAASPGVPAPPSGEPSLEDKVADFVTEYYLSGSALTGDELRDLYAARVDYFDGKRWSLERVIRDKAAYYRKWPQRKYWLSRETLRATWRRGSAKILDVSFEYEFDVASPSRVSRGRGIAELTLDLTLSGGRITRETGKVIQRW